MRTRGTDPLFDFPRKMSMRIGLILLAIFFIPAGINHFANAEFYLAIMPPYLPAHLELVYISGMFEILGGFGLLFSPVRRWAGYGLVGLTVAVFPANLYMAMNPDQFVDFVPVWALYVRLPLQLVFIFWIVWATGNDRSVK